MTLCPGCILDYTGQFGTEPEDRLRHYVKYKLCQTHRHLGYFEASRLADEKLTEILLMRKTNGTSNKSRDLDN